MTRKIGHDGPCLVRVKARNIGSLRGRSRLGSNAITTFDELIARAGIVVEPFDESLASAAFDAFRKYGKGQSNPAQLNIVDCVVYALARSRNLPLLFKGRDFSHTDIRSAVPFAVTSRIHA